MPLRKRTIEEFDPTKSDSNDSDFNDDAESRPRTTKSATRSRRTKPAHKKRRTGYGGDGSDDVTDDGSELSDESFTSNAQEDEPEPEKDPRTGRPIRKAAKAKVGYAESDEDDPSFLDQIEPSGQSDVLQTTKKKTAPPRRMIVKLNMTPGTRRSARATSVPLKRPTTSDGTTRRSSRIAQDDTDGLVALTTSGNHAEVTRPGTRSPEAAAPLRLKKGGKGLKKPPSAIFEADNESSGQTKIEPADDEADLDPEIAASREDLADGDAPQSNGPQGNAYDNEDDGDIEMNESAIVLESNDEDDDDDDEDEDVIAKKPRNRRRQSTAAVEPTVEEGQGIDAAATRSGRRSLRSAAELPTITRSSTRTKKRGIEDTSDFEPVADEDAEENVSESSDPDVSPRKASQDDDSGSNRRTRRGGRTRDSSRRAPISPVESEEADELAEELEELRGSRGARARRGRNQTLHYDSQQGGPTTRKRKPVDYRIINPNALAVEEDDDPPATVTPSRRGGRSTGAWQRPLFSTYGPFGGAGGPRPILGGPGGIGAVGGVDSDSSDDDLMPKPQAMGGGAGGVGGMVGMTPTSAAPPGFGLFPGAAGQAQGDALQASLGKVKNRQELADADPLGVDTNVNFDGVGGLQSHIDQLKEMVALPLLYPEIFQRFKVTPPRGVLFHGPPGTGKTLMARALASSVSSGGRKVTFYMRKGADALSKWVGEAERQLRLLFEEARKNQPSIIFFDEIDGLAPVRSSKQDQIHASIVSTLLALMDGMDGRGQVIVIGATNRPDSVDPALRRPGRFDREFYFPLPNIDARRKILDIHTKNWEPPIPPALKHELAELTKGYGGADLRALCTEAALNAVQRRYPQIYSSSEKLLIDPETIKIAAKDFMISVKKMVPSSERSASSGAAALPRSVEPLLKDQLQAIEKAVASILPQKKRVTALEEAQFEDAEGEGSMRAERMQQEFERCRVFRPRLLLRGAPGMGQQYLAAALLHHFEGLHVQSFDLPTLLSDSTRSQEAAVVQFFTEVKRHKPSVIYIPNVDVWYRTVGEAVISTFQTMLRSLSPTDPVLVLGVLEAHADHVDPLMIKHLFGYSKRNQLDIERPSRSARKTFFDPIEEYLNSSPSDFPDPADRKPRVLEKLAIAPPPAPVEAAPLTREQIKGLKQKDRLTLNMLKTRIQPVMDQIRNKYRMFRNSPIDEKAIRYLYEEADPTIVTSDIPQVAQFRPYEIAKDDKGEDCLLEVSSGKIWYNMNLTWIEERLANGYYKRPKDFATDIKKLAKDAKHSSDTNRFYKAAELQANVEVDMADIGIQFPQLETECEALYEREKVREKEMYKRAKQAADAEGRPGASIGPNLASDLNDLQPLTVPPVTLETTNTLTSATVTAAAAPVTDQPINGTTTRMSPPQKPTDSNHTILTNGNSDLSNLEGHRTESNGNSVPSRPDVHMTNSEDLSSTHHTQDSSFGPSAQTRPPHDHTGGPPTLQQRLSYPGSLSQKSVITPMAEGSHPGMYQNSASTTSSDKRYTGSSGPFESPSVRGRHDDSGPKTVEPPQGTNSTGADLSLIIAQVPSNSQLPSTQDIPMQWQQIHQTAGSPVQAALHPSQASIPNSSQSEPPSQPSQVVPAVPPFPRPHASAIHSLLNDAPAHPPLKVDKHKSHAFVEHLVANTSHCSVEQLEQVYSVLMSQIWQTRGVWNRVSVVDDLHNVLTEILADMADCQSFGPGSAEMEV